MDYKKTLNVTLNDKNPGAMPQRGNLPVREPEVQKYWDQIDLYSLSIKKDASKGTFVLHDGPPYSNGDIHLGHALNKIAKDIIIKYKTMQGYCAPYIPGWDNHGMPIENNVSKEFRKKNLKPDKITMRRRCREYAAGFVERQKEQFKRLGVRGDWDNPYTTMSSDFEAAILGVFAELADQGFIYRGLKPVLWCASCETALADAEVEYAQHTSNSIHVRFPVITDPHHRFGNEKSSLTNAYIVAWTTTPWTIPANLALAVHPDENYRIVMVNGDKYLIASPLLEKTLAVIFPGLPSHDIWEGTGKELEGMAAHHPLAKRSSPVVFANYVTMEDGTGIVHTAPGHGKEDFETGKTYGLDVLCPVNASGILTQQAGEEFEGARILGGEADQRVIEALRARGHLLSHIPFEHSYPHCWRCQSPLLFRATIQWFMSIDHNEHRKKSLKEIQNTKWFPPVSINRISSMVASRPDWCLSRQRAWGVGIPAFYCRSCGKEILDKKAIQNVQEWVKKESSDVWFSKSAAELLPEGFCCPSCSGTEFDKETDILDVWFDSGSTHRAVLENQERWPELKWPADVYLEGSDQHRGWFNSSLMVSIATRGRAPYDAVITNGFTVDENGKKMSKSVGNVIDPLKTMQTFGADILRLWVASTDYFEDVRCTDNIISQTSEAYRRIRNTFRFLINNIYDFDAENKSIQTEDMLELDQWILAQLDKTVSSCIAGYESFEFHRVFTTIHNFCAVELSAFYLDVLKDRLYCSESDSIERRSAQTALYRLAETMAKLLAPILSHTSEEVWGYLGRPGGKLSVQLADFPQDESDKWDMLRKQWEPLISMREIVNMSIETARQEKRIGNPLESLVKLTLPSELYKKLTPYSDVMPTVFKVSQVEMIEGINTEPIIEALPAIGEKCARCWLVRPEVKHITSYPDLCDRCAKVIHHISAQHSEGIF
jgi:isoleucyl-tRNA synthetase